jgi:hypothetical protein
VFICVDIAAQRQLQAAGTAAVIGGEYLSGEEMSEHIDVISMFKNKTVSPVKFRYAGRTHKVAKILYPWVTREGNHPVHHFSVLTADDNRFTLSLNTYTMSWVLDTPDANAASQ